MTMQPPPQLHPDTAEAPLLVSIREAARLLGIGRTTAWEMIRRGELPARRLRKRVLVPRAALERFALVPELDPEPDDQAIDAPIDAQSPYLPLADDVLPAATLLGATPAAYDGIPLGLPVMTVDRPARRRRARHRRSFGGARTD